MKFTILPARPEQLREAAHLIYDSTNAWYEKHFGISVFTGEKDSALLFCRTYAALDGPENLLIAWDEEQKRIAGSCFVHPRPTHVALGIMNVHPDYFGQGVAPLILKRIIEIAASRKQPLRLVSSAMNLDSFSLYNRLGFVPYAIFQDMIFPNFNPSKIAASFSDSFSALLASVREARKEDVAQITALDAQITGLNHTQDYSYFIQNPDGAWRTWVLEGADGRLDGVLSSVCDPGSCMLGPGLMCGETQMLALIFTAYKYYTQRCAGPATPVFLVPSGCSDALRTLYSWGARNTEIHVGQSLGPCESARGIVMPTFMPES